VEGAAVVVGVQTSHLAGILARVDADVGRHGDTPAVHPDGETRVRVFARGRRGHRGDAGGGAALL
jgi:hypothetical protein